jgi:hypothetical protein
MMPSIKKFPFYNFCYMMLSIYSHYEHVLQVSCVFGFGQGFELGLYLSLSIIATSDKCWMLYIQAP